MKENRVLILIIVVLAGILLFNLNKTDPDTNNQAPKKQVATINSPFGEKVNEEGEVRVYVKPVSLTLGQKASFELAFDTHSINLDFEIEPSIKLIDSDGKIYSRATWNGSAAGGHHRSGIITFEDPLTDTGKVDLIVTKIGNTAERKFRWNL